jgi:hypothetical protein
LKTSLPPFSLFNEFIVTTKPMIQTSINFNDGCRKHIKLVNSRWNIDLPFETRPHENSQHSLKQILCFTFLSLEISAPVGAANQKFFRQENWLIESFCCSHLKSLKVWPTES